MGSPPPGTVGITRRQLVRLSVVHHSPSELPVPPCNIVAEILSAEGKVLAQKLIMNPGPDQGDFIDFVHPGDGAGFGSRLQLHGHVRHTPGHLVGASMEVIDQLTGLTTLPEPPCNLPDETLGQDGGHTSLYALPGTLGIARGQLARLSVVNHGHSQGQGLPSWVIQIINAKGQMLAEQKGQALGVGEGAFVDFEHPAEGPFGLAGRIELFGRVRHTPGFLIGGTLEIVNRLGGATQAVGPTSLVADAALPAV